MSGNCDSTAISGRSGFVVAIGYTVNEQPTFTRLARIMGWRARQEVSVTEWCDSGSLGTLWSMASVGQATGEMNFAFDTELNQHVRVHEGGSYGLWLCASPTSFLIIPSGIVSSMDFDVDVDAGKVVGGHAEFRSSGPYFDYAHMESAYGSQTFLRGNPLGVFGDEADPSFDSFAAVAGQLSLPPATAA